MSDFWLFFDLGRDHILDIKAYDHVLFVVALCAAFRLSEWKRVLILVTAFTTGHSVTLAMVVLDVIKINAALVETLIPITILLTALSNIHFRNKQQNQSNLQLNYTLALVFGFIHGMGFSNYLKSLLGSDISIVNQLLAFNVGLELGQVFIVFGFFGIVFIVERFKLLNKPDWVLAVSSAVGGVSITLLLDVWF
ncbi:HupE/UreJ family protein [Reichenbachiella versicolor]|uniref:HupE/UreJ family protein n=1 Tax=Reichenbachiella versicolor TaxID=1821036 RepID=UPI000D6E00DB|nr:HupE/UreJ family protein [Reichenbachiella versicolor]